MCFYLLFSPRTSLFSSFRSQVPEEDGVRRNWRRISLRRCCLEDTYCLGAHFVSAWPQGSQFLPVLLVLEYIKFRMNSISLWWLWPEAWSQLLLAAVKWLYLLLMVLGTVLTSCGSSHSYLEVSRKIGISFKRLYWHIKSFYQPSISASYIQESAMFDTQG